MKWKYCFLNEIPEEELVKTYENLSPSRQSYIDSFSHSLSKKRSLAGEYLVKKLLREEFSLENTIIEREESGKPFVKGKEVFISISHCDEFIVCAADFKALGIDTEKIKPINKSLIDRVCIEEEKKFVMENGEINSERFFTIWTGKEAYFKRLGTGITDFKSVNVLTLNTDIFRIGDYLIQII